MEVTLVDLPVTASVPVETSVRRSLKPLVAKLGSDQSPIYLSDDPDSDINAMAERLHQERRLHAETPQTSIRSVIQAPPSPPYPSPPSTKSASTTAGASSEAGSIAGLWGRIEPCWRARSGRAAVPVRLEVAIDARGQLAKPPVILRGNAAVDERRLTAEADALAALGSCLPRGELRFRGQTYQLEFPAG